MRKIFLFCILFFAMLPVHGDELPFEYFRDLDLQPITTDNVDQLQLLD